MYVTLSNKNMIYVYKQHFRYQKNKNKIKQMQTN